MTKHLVVDSSVFLSHLISNDANHAASREFFNRVKKEKLTLVIPMIAFFELLHVYFRITEDSKKTDELYQEMILWNISKTLRLVNLEANFLIHFAAHHELFSVKTSDAVLAVTALHLKYPLITWDKRLQASAKKHIEAMTPEEYML